MLRPSKDIGRPGTVCPFPPRSVERKKIWFAAELTAVRSAPDVVELVSGYKRLLQDELPIEGDDVIYKVIANRLPRLAGGACERRL